MAVNANGIIVPSLDDVNTAVAQLLTDLQTDPNLNARFRANPGEYLKSIGIPSDGVKEVMTDLHLTEEAIFTVEICGWTCLWTKCIWTGSAQAVVLSASVEPFKG